MTSYRGPRDGGETDSNSPELLDASVCGSTEVSESGEANIAPPLPPKGGSHREFLGRPALRLMWMPVASDFGGKIK